MAQSEPSGEAEAREGDGPTATSRRRLLSRCGGLGLAVAVAAPAGAAGAQRPAGTSARETAALQQAANASPGPRRAPAKVIPVPSVDLSAAARKAIAGPYGVGIAWNADPGSDAAWRAMLREADAASLPALARDRQALGLAIEERRVGGVRCFMVTPETVPARHRDHLIVNLHGGGYVYGAGLAGTGEAMLIAALGGYRVLAVDYRMPPDAPFPAGLNDAVAVWRQVVADHDPRRLAIAGTSAGGGLTLATVLRARREGLPLPAAIAPSSPWADLTETGDSYAVNEWVDNVLVSYSGYLGRAARLYAGDHDMRDPLVSPVYGDLAGFPPTILTAGTRDLFLSNAVRTHRRLRRAGVEARLQVFEGLSHSQFLFDRTAPETREVFGEIAAFFDAHLS